MNLLLWNFGLVGLTALGLFDCFGIVVVCWLTTVSGEADFSSFVSPSVASSLLDSDSSSPSSSRFSSDTVFEVIPGCAATEFGDDL